MLQVPEKKIKLPAQVDILLKGKTINNFFQFIVELQTSITGLGISKTPKIKEFEIYNEYFTKIREVLAATPPKEGKMRFGNMAFRDFHPKMNKLNKEFCEKLLDHLKLSKTYSIILETYLNDSYGDKSRVDYGTGHELNFMVFLYIINKLSNFTKEKHPAVVHQIFYDYIFTMRQIQLQYKLEPAGSHGVWGLDDYHFLPFIFGAAELINNQIFLLPSYIHKIDLVEDYKDEFMYLNCVSFIKFVKSTAPFGETSPYLNDISGAKSWEKVAVGLIKMYKVEVWSKHPVMKHLRFCELFPFE